MNPIADLTAAGRGLSLIAKGDPKAAGAFRASLSALIVALGWLALALILSAAAQSAAAGPPSLFQLTIGLLIQGLTVAALALVTWQTTRFLRLPIPLLRLLVPTVYLLALVQLLAIPLALLGPNAQLIAVLFLALALWRAARVLGDMGAGVALAFALLCLMVLVVVPNALYILLSQLPSPA
ncbi:MAG TPA: hypothetical protein VFE52_04665 [Devosia sp.]|nr:hypothetical protein [Devosia sp.]